MESNTSIIEASWNIERTSEQLQRFAASRLARKALASVNLEV